MHAPPLEPDHVPKAKGVRELKPLPSQGQVVLLMTEEDLSPETLELDKTRVAAIVAADTAAAYAGVSEKVAAFKKAALQDAAWRASRHFGCACAVVSTEHLAEALSRTVQGAYVVTSEMPIGPARTAIFRALPDAHEVRDNLYEIRREWDAAFWPHATAGFFKVKDKIRSVFRELGPLSVQAGDLFSFGRDGAAGSSPAPGE